VWRSNFQTGNFAHLFVDTCCKSDIDQGINRTLSNSERLALPLTDRHQPNFNLTNGYIHHRTYANAIRLACCRS
jgi:hypothetical protein